MGADVLEVVVLLVLQLVRDVVVDVLLRVLVDVILDVGIVALHNVKLPVVETVFQCV